MITSMQEVNLSSLVRCPLLTRTGRQNKIYSFAQDYPEIYILNDFISGHLRTRGTCDGKYPMPYLDMIEKLFGRESNTIEVCSRSIVADNEHTAFTVDLNPDFKPSLVTDGQTLAGVRPNKFDRWRCDPPYNSETAGKMYGSDLPSYYKLLEAGARVCKKGSLMFLLLGPTNYQIHPSGIKRIGLIFLSVVPNNEIRCCNIFYKYSDTNDSSHQSQLDSDAKEESGY
ncbi:MAG: hypothetical protein ACRD5H_12715 [Nitrososphaerales archaeon]